MWPLIVVGPTQAGKYAIGITLLMQERNCVDTELLGKQRAPQRNLELIREAVDRATLAG